ncbi:MAG: hypothetical protein QNJ40_16255 [Xanthomonadales bacterium]|nr:hypothetical protein [Xanthomonadales bacterium]
MTKPKSALDHLRRAFLLVVTASCTAGCVGAAVSTTTYATKSASRDALWPPAARGDAEAQYELGKSYCCMGPGFDTQTATAWLCKAASQDNAKAMVELGRIYLGDVSRTPSPGQKILRAVSAKEAKAVAHVWLSRASAAGNEKAGDWLAKLSTRMTDDDFSKARALDQRWPDVPCEYNHVFGE